MSAPSVLIVAIGGYGYYYLQELLAQEKTGRVTLAGVVDPQARESRGWADIASRDLPVADSIEAFYGSGHRADVAVIVSPIQCHVPQSVVALAHGSDVLCDKPLGATVQEARELIEARDRSGRWVMIGYQWSYSSAIRDLKRDILAGLFGRPLRLAALTCWPRDAAYYRRNHWAGRLRDPRSGRWVLDSPANNGMAHYLHNLLFLAGDAMERSALPRIAEGEHYRAYDIESADTTCLRLLLDGGVEVLHLASHATEETIQPRFRLDFDAGTVTCDVDRGGIVATLSDGSSRSYGLPDDSPHFQKLSEAIAAAGAPCTPLCGPEASMAQTLAINGLHESRPVTCPFPAGLVREDLAAGRRYVPGLATVLEQCYERNQLPSEIGAEWADRGARIDLHQYVHYPSGLQVAAKGHA
jgi:predicted dehydrogenase